MAIPRTCTYHRARRDVSAFLRALRFRTPRGPTDACPVAQVERAVAEHVGAEHAVAFSSARSAVFHVLAGLRAEPGDEVILPPLTIRGMADAVEACGLVPKYVDLDPRNLLFDSSLLDGAITRRTRAVVVTYLFGVPADPSRLVELCRRRGVLVIEDFSQNLGGTAGPDGRSVGTLGDVGVYSASVTKVLDTFGGGVAVTDDVALADGLQSARRALDPATRRRLVRLTARGLVLGATLRDPVFSWVMFPVLRAVRRWVPSLERTVSGAEPHGRRWSLRATGAFERYSALQAEEGLHQLALVAEHDQARVGHSVRLRRQVARLGGEVPAGDRGARGSWWQTVVYVDQPRVFQRAMARWGVDVAPTNLSLLADLPVARRVKEQAMYLPTAPGLTDRDLDRVEAALASALRSGEEGRRAPTVRSPRRVVRRGVDRG